MSRPSVYSTCNAGSPMSNSEKACSPGPNHLQKSVLLMYIHTTQHTAEYSSRFLHIVIGIGFEGLKHFPIVAEADMGIIALNNAFDVAV